MSLLMWERLCRGGFSDRDVGAGGVEFIPGTVLVFSFHGTYYPFEHLILVA